ncbi:MAG TPA: PIG-L family deacetylase [Flavobacteriales bacterium]|nr:PIG-L family deacetylase [Flavobacteriales bacterium]
MPVKHRLVPRILMAALLACAPALAQNTAAQTNDPSDAARILHQMEKLQVAGSVLYVAAHPDDENTRLISWLSNGRKVRTGYLSLTRGDGGQNLIGPELGDALGIIRTEELLAARRIDGGEQFFTRASDFGFSKNADESFEKWGKQEVLSDVVRVIRIFRPDVIITRFPPDRGAGHGHHEASAILALEAFDLAGDPNAFPEQLAQGLEVWQPQRLFFNGSTWWNKDLAELAKTEKDWYVVDVGGYDPLLGQAYSEIAGRSRSMHKSQGFGAPEARGEQLEYLHFEKGTPPKGADILGGLDLTWDRMKGGKAVTKAINALLAAYDLRQPEKSVPLLESLAAAVDALPASPWKSYTRARVDQLLMDVTGTVVEALASTPFVVTGDSTFPALTLLTRSPVQVMFASPQGTWDTLSMNQVRKVIIPLLAPDQPDRPFWLERPHGALFDIKEPRLIGLAVAPTRLQIPYELRFAGGTVVKGQVPVLYRTVDRVKGEVTEYCEVVPPISISARPNLLLVRGKESATQLEVEAFTKLDHVDLRCELMAEWDVEPAELAFGEMEPGSFKALPVTITATRQPGPNSPYIRGEVGHTGPTNLTRRRIQYDHIPDRSWYTPATFRAEPLDAQVNAEQIGYIMGAGDEVPAALEALGLEVDLIDPATATVQGLAPYDAVVVGIRAYNMVPAMKALDPALKQYVHNGGIVVVQYITVSSDMVMPDTLIGPYPFRLTRGRVTVEEAPPSFPYPKHELLNTPNKITMADFDGWVQERGLYFAGSIDPHYTPLITWSDPGEQPLDGGLIACDYGKGRFVYTGISFFRQLPAGVPGAYRLFANLISKKGGIKKEEIEKRK